MSGVGLVSLPQQAVQPFPGREVRRYQCPYCARTFAWHVVKRKGVTVMPSHIDPFADTWCQKSGEAL